MKVKELIDGLSKYPDHLDDTITIEKHDKKQLCCSGTVPVKDWQFGFDWEHGQVILRPEIDLCTLLDIQNQKVHDKLDNLGHKLIQNWLIASKIRELVDDRITDEKLKMAFHEMLEQIKL